MQIKAIETVYKGCRFRSRLEARWAVFLDHMKEPWEYEKEGYQLPSGWYLPDFWLPQEHTWLEIKPDELSELEQKKCLELATITKKDVIAAVGLPKIPTEMEVKEVMYKDGPIGDYLKAYEHMLNGKNYGRCDKMPFVHKGHVGFFPNHFRNWIVSSKYDLSENEFEDYLDEITEVGPFGRAQIPDFYPKDYLYINDDGIHEPDKAPCTEVLSRNIAIPEYKFKDTNMYFYEEGVSLSGAPVYLNKLEGKLVFDFSGTSMIQLTKKDIQTATMARFEFGESGLKKKVAKNIDPDKLKKENLKKKALDVMSHLLGFKIYKFIKSVQDKDPNYRIVTDKGDIYFNSPEDIMTLDNFQARIMANLNIALNLDKKSFSRVKECYELVIEEVFLTENNIIKSWIIEYLDGEPHRNQHESARGDYPFVHNGNWHIFSSKFREWAFRNKHYEKNIQRLTRDMKLIGAEQCTFTPQHPKNPNNRIKKKPWKIPYSICPVKRITYENLL